MATAVQFHIKNHFFWYQVKRYIVPSDKSEFIDTFEDEDEKIVATGGVINEQKRFAYFWMDWLLNNLSQLIV